MMVFQCLPLYFVLYILSQTQQLQLEFKDVGAVLVNGRAASFDKIFQDNDRVAFLPQVGPMLLIGIKLKNFI